ncbi:hypothetical protein [Streptomyces sp. NPDC059247]|uniref:hypothetical protein n=1 Tax=Streptomyces sp. NPDC059247 TaxID=3346790 RepID=UPI00367ED28F
MRGSLALAIGGSNSGGGDFYSALFFLLFFLIGISLAIDLKGCAETFYRFVSGVMPGGGGMATPRTIRLVGSVMAVLGFIGVVTEVVAFLG